MKKFFRNISNIALNVIASTNKLKKTIVPPTPPHLAKQRCLPYYAFKYFSHGSGMGSVWIFYVT